MDKELILAIHIRLEHDMFLREIEVLYVQWDRPNGVQIWLGSGDTSDRSVVDIVDDNRSKITVRVDEIQQMWLQSVHHVVVSDRGNVRARVMVTIVQYKRRE